MFCPNCGNKNEDDALFCGSCGTRLIQAQTVSEPEQQQTVPQPQAMPQQQAVSQPQAMQQQQYYMPVQPKEKKPFRVNKLVVATSIMAVVFIASVVVFVVIGNNTYSAKAVASDYFKAVHNNDWDTAYDMLDISESEFINKDLYIKAMSDKADARVSKYAVKITDENSVEANASVVYRATGTDGSGTDEFTLNRQKGRQFLLFKSWKVSSSSVIAKDFQISVPKGAELYMDGELVDESYISDDDGYNVSYIIPKLFKGEHTLNIAAGDYKSNVEKYDVTYDNDYYGISSVNIDEKSQKEIIDTAYGYLEQIIDASTGGKQFTEIEDIFTEDAKEDAANEYDSYFAHYFYPYTNDDGITAVTLTKVKADVNDYYFNNGKLEFFITFDYHVKNDGVAKDWWTGELKNGTNEGDETSSMSLVYEDGKWLMDDEYSFPSGVIYHTWFN